MAISINLTYSKKEQVSNLDAKKMHQRCVKGFTSIGLAITTHAFDFMANLNIDCSMLREDINRTFGTHTSLPASFLGLENATLITSNVIETFIYIIL